MGFFSFSEHIFSKTEAYSKGKDYTSRDRYWTDHEQDIDINIKFFLPIF